MYKKVTTSTIALAFMALSFAGTAHAQTQLLQRDFVIDSSAIETRVLASTPQIIPAAEAGSYAAVQAQSNPFSGWRLLAASMLLSGCGGFSLWRFVSRETELMERS